MHIVGFQHIPVLRRILKETPAVRRLLTVIQPMEKHIQVASADDLSACQRTDGVDMLLPGQKHVVMRGILFDPFARFDRVGGKELITGYRFAPDGQRTGEHARPDEQAAQQPTSAKTRQPLHENRAVIRGENHREHEPDVKQLVIVVFIRLEEDRLRDGVNRRHAQHEIQMPAPPCVQTGADDEDERQTRILHPEPEIPILEAAPAAVVDPVELEAKRAALQRLPDRVAQHLRQGEHQHDAQIDARSNQDARTPLFLNDEPAENIAARKQPQREEGMGMHQRKRTCPQREQHRLPHGFFAERGNQQIQRRNAHRPAAQQRPLRNHQIGDDIGKTQVEIRLIGGRLIIAGEDFLHAGKVVGKRQIKVIQKAQSAVKEEQQCRDSDRFVPSAENLLSQKHVARIGQRHQQCSRHDECQIERHAEHIKRRAERIRQIRIGERRPRQQVIRRRKAHVLHRGDKRQVHAQVAVGGLSAPV